MVEGFLEGPRTVENLLCGAANLGRSRLLGGQGRLKAGCGQNCPPHPIGCHSIVRASLVSESRAPA